MSIKSHIYIAKISNIPNNKKYILIFIIIFTQKIVISFSANQN